MIVETFASLLDQNGVDLPTLTQHLNGLSQSQRSWEVTLINSQQQQTLWEVAGRTPTPATLDHICPTSASNYEPVPFDGKNSLPAFKKFQKVFYRQKNGEIGGFNNAPLMWFTGPGYYVAEMVAGHDNEIGVNYIKTPESNPQGWPQIKPNTVIPTRFIYGNMIDYLRWVSDDVFIGRAYRAGTTPMPNWFVLARADRMR